MHKIKAMLTLIRFPNLVFIFLTQCLAWFFLLKPFLNQHAAFEILGHGRIFLLAFSTVLIAAAGYMINDYFDIGIDAINKPERVTIEKIFKRRTIIIGHALLNVIAILLAGFIAYRYSLLRYTAYQVLSIFLLLVYSTTFKRKLLSGNLIISILTALTLFSLAAYEVSFPLFDFSIISVQYYWLYILFAFLITFCREVTKDIEDIKGDTVQDCKTIPLVWGIQIAKNIVNGIIFFLIILILCVSLFWFSENLTLVLFWIVMVCMPLLYVIYLMRKANQSIHFHRISALIKLITFAGILSMIFF